MTAPTQAKPVRIVDQWTLFGFSVYRFSCGHEWTAFNPPVGWPSGSMIGAIFGCEQCQS